MRFATGIVALGVLLSGSVPAGAASSVSLVSADASSGRVALVWRAPGAAVRERLERSTPHDHWHTVATLAPDPLGFLRFDDRDVAPGQRYGYRLIVPDGLQLDTIGEVWVQVPPSTLMLTIASPLRGRVACDIVLADSAPARLELCDVMGRRLASRTLQGAGAHHVEIGNVMPGVVLARLTQAAESRVGRAIVVR